MIEMKQLMEINKETGVTLSTNQTKLEKCQEALHEVTFKLKQLKQQTHLLPNTESNFPYIRKGYRVLGENKVLNFVSLCLIFKVLLFKFYFIRSVSSFS